MRVPTPRVIAGRIEAPDHPEARCVTRVLLRADEGLDVRAGHDLERTFTAFRSLLQDRSAAQY